MDVFRGQMTDPVLLKLRENSIFLFRVPPNMTNLFQLLDLNVNGAAKAFLKRKYIEWYSGEISKALADGIALDDIEIKLKLSVLKPFQAKWIVELQLSTSWGRARPDRKRLGISRNNRSNRRFSEFRKFRFICSDRSSRTWQNSPLIENGNLKPVWHLKFCDLLLLWRWWRRVGYRRESNQKYIWNYWRRRLKL